MTYTVDAQRAVPYATVLIADIPSSTLVLRSRSYLMNVQPIQLKLRPHLRLSSLGKHRVQRVPIPIPILRWHKAGAKHHTIGSM